MEKQRRISVGILLAAMVVAGLVLLLAHHWYLQQARADHLAKTLALASTLNDHVLQRTRYAAARVATNPVIAASARGDLPLDDPAVLSVLETLRASLDAEIVYVMSPEGDTLASTRFDGDKHLTGNNYAFRPYFFLALTIRGRIIRSSGWRCWR